MKLQRSLRMLMIGVLWIACLVPGSATMVESAGRHDDADIAERLKAAALLLVTTQLELEGVEYTILGADVAVQPLSARVVLRIGMENSLLGRVDDTVNVFALLDGQNIVRVFREPSPEFYLYADQVASSLLDPARLAFWKQLIAAEGSPQLLAVSDAEYKLPWTGGASYYVYQDDNKHFDFGLPTGTLVRAARGGLASVRRASVDGGCGEESCNQYNNYVRITHADGTYGWYMHFRFGGILVNTNDQLTQGACLGYSGSTGISSGPHLHFNVSTTSGNIPESSWVEPQFVEGTVPDRQTTPASLNSTSACGVSACCGCGTLATPGASSATNTQTALLANLPALRNAFARPSGAMTAQTPPLPVADMAPPSSVSNLQGEARTIAGWHSQPVVRVHWTAAQDAAGPLAGYAVAWSQDPQTEPPVTALQPADTEEATSPPLTTGHWYVHVRAVDRAGNAGATVHAGPFLVDVTAPAWPDGAVTDERAWQNRADLPHFTWPAAVDEASGVAGYRVYWGDDPTGTAETSVSEPAYAPPAGDAPAADTVRYLRVAPLDHAGNRGEWRTVAVWRHDRVLPSAVMLVNDGGETVRSLNVTLNLTTEDAGSGVAAMHFSTDGVAWTPWEPYAPYRTWQFEDVPGPQAVYAQVRDVAGNLSKAAQASVTAVLNVELPSSTSYRIARSVLGMGGGTKTSASYRVQGTSGQPSGAGVLAGSSYRVRSGFWAGMTCPLAEFAAAPDISVNGAIVTLEWDAVVGASSYRIYRGAEPYFVPGTPYDATSNTAWTDSDGGGAPSVNHTYVVKTVNSCGESSTLYRVGEFRFALTAGK